MSIVIDEVEKELSKDYKTRRDSPQCLTILKSDNSICEIFTRNLYAFECVIYRGGKSTIGATLYSSGRIIDWVKKAL